jgi:hypothetical protein
VWELASALPESASQSEKAAEVEAEEEVEEAAVEVEAVVEAGEPEPATSRALAARSWYMHPWSYHCNCRFG